MTTRLLAVDDDEQVRELVASCCQGLGIDCVTANSAEDGLAKLAATNGNFNVVLSDYKMTGMWGDELLARVKERWPNTITGLMSGTMPKDCAGAQFTLIKPFYARQLFAAISPFCFTDQDNLAV